MILSKLHRAAEVYKHFLTIKLTMLAFTQFIQEGHKTMSSKTTDFWERINHSSCSHGF